MSICDIISKTRGQLPPISNNRGYSIRKSARVSNNFSRPQALERYSRSVPMKKSPAKPKPDPIRKLPDLPFALPDLFLGKCIGRGKGGRVVIGTAYNSDYAIKIISKDLSKYALIESTILEKTDNKNIVKYFGKLEDETNIYLVLELITGSDLFHFMRRQRLRLPKVTLFTAQVLEAIAGLHCLGIVYRDLKPENIMIDENEKVKLVDFGLSKVIENERTYTVCGSPEYMAPEIIRKSSYGYSVDFWALGILIYELLCGHPPFQGDSFPELCNNILCGSYEFTRSIDASSKDLIRKLLHPEPAFRLGVLENKVNDIKNHRFFQEVSWDEI